MGAAGNKKPKKPKDKNHVPAYEKEETMNGFDIGTGKKKKKQKQKSVSEKNPMRFYFGWATKIRTWNDRTRICSVTITPQPNR